MDRHVNPQDSFLDEFDSWYHGPVEPSSLPWVEGESERSSPAPFVGSDVGESAYCANGRHHGSIPATLPLLQLADWDEDEAYEEQPPTCLHYSIEWKLTCNGKTLRKDTEPNLVLAPGAYWRKFLQPKLEKLARNKLRARDSAEIDDTDVTVSVRDRSERDLVKCFDGFDVDWKLIERQLCAWAALFLEGKPLRLVVSFNYVESETQGTAPVQSRKRGRISATRSMLSDRAGQLDAEQALGQQSTWSELYQLMRCPGPPCHLGPYCWRDTEGKRHYKLLTHHLTSLVKHIELGHPIQCHDDVPNYIRNQLYAEEQQKTERKRKRDSSPTKGIAPIQVVLPTQLPHTLEGRTGTPRSPVTIVGLRDQAVREYSEWQCSNVGDNDLKLEFQKARDLTLAEGLDLEQLYEEHEHQFLVEKGVKRGIARRFVRDIKTWARQ